MVNTLRQQRLSVVVVLLAVAGAGTARAIDPGTRLTQYAHSTWNIADGTFAGSPNTVTQTSDGYLWIGTNLGLVRFDGARFVPWNPPPGERLQDSRVFSLLGSEDGSLWIGTGYGLSRWKDGKLTNYPGLSGRIEALLEDSSGSVWLARTQIVDGMGPVCRIRDDHLTCYGSANQVPFPNVLELAPSDDGWLWLVGYSEICRWKPGSAEVDFPNRTHRREGIPLFTAIASSRDGSAWLARSEQKSAVQLQYFMQGHWISQGFAEAATRGSQITTLFVDRDGELWIGTSLNGVFRVRDGRVEHYSQADGLSSNSVLKFFQDAEGTVWVVTSAGIDNFRDLHVLSYSMREGLSSDDAVSVLASRDGGLWVLDDYNTIQKLKDGRFTTVLPRPGLAGHVSTMFEDHEGRLWFGFEDGLYEDDRGVFHAILRANGAPLGLVFSITEDADHNLWVRDLNHLDEIVGGHIARELTSDRIATGYILAGGADDSVYLGMVDGDLMEFRDGTSRTVASGETGNTSQIRDLLVDSDGTVWGTTVNELVSWRGSTRHNLTVRNGLPCDGIFALVEDESRAIWLYSQCGLIRIARAELDRWWQNPDSTVQVRLQDESDGVHSGLTSLKPQATRTTDGRLWFANGRVVQMFDPGHERMNPVAPPVQIEAVVADRKDYQPREGMELPPLTSDLEIEYTALSYVAPQKVSFRYRLENRDVQWQEPGKRRQAFYSGLTPGKYRFQVVARNNDGLWNERGAVLVFTIAPAWFQTWWFRILCIGAALAAIWTIYRLRVRQIAVAMNQRFDERLDERTRLARDFHDTLLQTIQGSKMVADDALDESADAARMHQALEKLSVWMGQATVEGRAALHSLRTSTIQRNDLAEAFRSAAESDLLPSTMSVSFSVAGTPSEMHPIVRDEIYRIGYEAIRNAAAHSGGSQLDIELRYSQDLTLRVRDNGVGVDPQVLDRGRTGHFGLQGMRERTARIGGKFTIVSSPASGTEIQIVVPGGIIFRKTGPSRDTLASRIRKFFQRRI